MIDIPVLLYVPIVLIIVAILSLDLPLLSLQMTLYFKKPEKIDDDDDEHELQHQPIPDTESKPRIILVVGWNNKLKLFEVIFRTVVKIKLILFLQTSVGPRSFSCLVYSR